MRDRLIELSKKAHSEWLKKEYDHETHKDLAEYVADHLLAEGVIVPPCKVGQTVYCLTTVDTEKELNVAEIFKGIVKGIGFDGENIWSSVKYTNGLFYYHTTNDFGKTVFLTREEAEKALKERSENGKS